MPVNMMDAIESGEIKLGDIPDAPKLPNGTYRATVVGEYETIENPNNGNTGKQWNIRLKEPVDVDEEALQEFLEASGTTLRELTPLRHTIWNTENPKYRLQFERDFLLNVLGIDSQLSLKRAYAEAAGKDLLVTLNRTQRNGREYLNIRSMARAPE